MFDSLTLFTYRACVKTREKILDVAGRLFATQGYADTSLAQVARSAEVSKALILWHFNSKDDLFRTALQNFLSPYSIDDTGLHGLSEQEQFEKLIDDYYTGLSLTIYRQSNLSWARSSVRTRTQKRLLTMSATSTACISSF